MRSLLSLLAGLCLAVPAFAAAPANYTAVTALHVEDASGKLLASGTATFTPVDGNGQPVSVMIGGGGQMLLRAAQTQVVNGALSINLADVSLTAPSYFCYRVQIVDNGNKRTNLIDIPCIQPTGAGYVLDNYSTSTTPIQPISSQGFVGNLTINGNVTVTGNISGTINTTGAVNAGSVDAPAITEKGLAVAPGYAVGAALGAGGAMVGLSAENGIPEKFFADFHSAGATNADGSAMMPGFETQSNSYAQQGHWNCKTCTNSTSTPAYLVRALTFNNDPTYAVQAVMHYGASSTLSCIGFNNASYGSFVNPTAAGFIGTCFTASHWVMYNNGTATTLPTCTSAGKWYDVSFWYYNGHVRASCMPLFATTAQTANYDGVTPPASIVNFEVTSAAVDDQIEYARYSIGGGSPGSNFLNMPYSTAQYNPAAVWTDTPAGTVWVLVPRTYKPGVANRWVIYDHGYNEVGWNITGGGNQGVANVANALANAGYVVLGFNNTLQNCYGNPQCVTDHTTVINDVTSMLSLAPQPYMMADSMGGFSMLNAIMHGAVQPRAIAGMCINTNLAWDYNSGGAATLINTAYGTPYATATAGYDPELASGTALSNLLVPTMLWSSYSDTTVLRANNTDMYQQLINSSLPAGATPLVTVITSTGAHEDLSNFNGPAVVSFFNAH